MNDRIRTLLTQITTLENDLHTALQEQQTSMFFQIKSKRIEFEGSKLEEFRIALGKMK